MLGYIQIIGENGVEHYYRTDFGRVALDGPPDVDDAAFLKKMQRFAHDRWSAGEDSPFRWEADDA